MIKNKQTNSKTKSLEQNLEMFSFALQLHYLQRINVSAQSGFRSHCRASATPPESSINNFGRDAKLFLYLNLSCFML